MNRIFGKLTYLLSTAQTVTDRGRVAINRQNIL